jgi:hypothetical protein
VLDALELTGGSSLANPMYLSRGVVADMDLEGVEAGLDRHQRGAPVVLGDALDPGRVHGAEARAHRREAGRRRQGGGAGGAGVGHRPGVSDLGRRRSALGVDGVGQLAQSGQGLCVEEQAVAVGASFGGDGQVSHRGHGDPAGRHPPVEGDQLVADPAPRHDPLEGGCLDDAVLEG